MKLNNNFIMFLGPSQGNRHLQKRLYDRQQEQHLDKIRNAKPIIRPLDAAEISLNNSKKLYQNEQRFTEIERQNRLLLTKITTIMNKTRRGTSFSQKAERSLNKTYRRRQLQSIEVQNAKMLKRLQQKKSSYQIDLLKKDWQRNKYTMQLVSRTPYLLSSHRPKDRGSTLNSFRKHDRFDSDVEMVRVRQLQGLNFLITLKLSSRGMWIGAECKDRPEMKVIELSRTEAIEFVEEECFGKIEGVFDRLRYDESEGVLYLIGNDVEVQQLLQRQRQKYLNNSAFDRNRDASTNPQNHPEQPLK